MEHRINQEMLPAFQGIIPATLTTTSQDGTPNVTYISQVYQVDETHVAITRQFFNKSWRNISENPKFAVVITNPENWKTWRLTVTFESEAREGPVYEEMEMILSAIASMQGMSDVFKLESAVICKISAIDVIFHGKGN